MAQRLADEDLYGLSEPAIHTECYSSLDDFLKGPVIGPGTGAA